MLNLEDSNTTEINPNCKNKIIDLLPEQKAIEGLGGNMRLGAHDMMITKGSMAYHLYGKKQKVKERFRHRYELNPIYISQFEEKGIVFSGRSPKAPIMQIFELKGHPFFVGTQAHPEFRSRPLQPSPLYIGFIKA